MQCDLCGYPIRADNVVGVCRSNSVCKNEGQRRQKIRKAQGLVGTGPTCGSCGEPLRSGNQTGYCTSKPECQSARRKLYFVPAPQGAPCEICGEPTRQGNSYGVCNRESCGREYGKRRYAANRDEMLAYSRRWYEANPGRVKQLGARRRAYRAGVIHVPWRWEDVLSRSGGMCYLCRQPFTADDGPTPDHIIPLSKGGWDWTLNVVAAHGGCNTRKKDGVNPVSLNVKAAAASMQLAAMLGYIGWKVNDGA
jgi:5-methylcytosine-specific restriction endonuclease McrA